LGDDSDQAGLLAALDQSQAYLKRLPPDKPMVYGPDTYAAAHLIKSLETFSQRFRQFGPGPELTKALKADFVLYAASGQDGSREALCTGYYEPELSGSPEWSERCLWPVYALPDDLIDVDLELFDQELAGRRLKGRLQGRDLVPYYSRHDIDRKKILAGRNLELYWVDDPIALFFLHIQGSGRIRLTDGTTARVGYAGANGRKYRSVGRLLLDKGLVDAADMSMQTIKSWLETHPEQMAEILDHNDSYVFFKRAEDGPRGNINVPLTPGRSVALDHLIFPKGALGWLQTRLPEVHSGEITGWQDRSRFVLVQDTGGAIKGPARIDLFFGYGPDQEAAAGRMKEKSFLYFPVLKKTAGTPPG
jgi:membrane-bound lytic murein transglycosylase A